MLRYKHYCEFSNILGNDIIKNYYEYCNFYDNIKNDKLKNVIQIFERLINLNLLNDYNYCTLIVDDSHHTKIHI